MINADYHHSLKQGENLLSCSEFNLTLHSSIRYPKWLWFWYFYLIRYPNPGHLNTFCWQACLNFCPFPCISQDGVQIWMQQGSFGNLGRCILAVSSKPEVHFQRLKWAGQKHLSVLSIPTHRCSPQSCRSIQLTGKRQFWQLWNNNYNWSKLFEVHFDIFWGNPISQNAKVKHNPWSSHSSNIL